MPAAVSRRALLAAALAAAGSAACTSSGSTPPPLPSPTPPTKEQLTRMAAVAREKELGRLARAALDANPGMAGARSTLSFSGQHVQALSETLVPSDSTSSHAAGSQTGSSARSQNLASRAASARTLASALLHAAAAHRAAATSADSDLARLLVSVAASDSALAAGLQRGGA